jgi:GntR family transcriptional regulator, transcriptional repressor for pyruvate dehydrogenase complex
MAAPSSKRVAFTPLRSARKSDEVYEQIAKLIRNGRFPPGTRLPAERELAAQINASRQTVREALYRAELAGLIEVRHGAGSFVRSAKASEIEKPVLELIAMQADRIGEVFELRRLIEGWCCAQAARRARKADLGALRERLGRMRALALTDPAWEENDLQFHVAIARSTGNPVATRIIELLRESFSALYRLKDVIPNLEDKELVWRHHRDVYDAIRRRDPEAAKSAIVAHMDYIERQLQAGLRNIESDS